MDNYVALGLNLVRHSLIETRRVSDAVETTLKDSCDLRPWDRALEIFNNITYHDLPHFSLYISLEDAAIAAREFRDVLAEINANGRHNSANLVMDRLRLITISKRLNSACEGMVNTRDRFGGKTPWRIGRAWFLRARLAIRDRLRTG